MKKVFPILFLVIFLFNTTGYYILYKITRYQIKEKIECEIKAGIYTDDLVKITIHNNDLAQIIWEEPGKEMRFENQLYDVVKITETATTKTYYCIDDKKEDSLCISLNDHINTHVSSNLPLKNSKHMIKNSIKLYFSNKPLFEFHSTYSDQNFIAANFVITSLSVKKNAPPPRFVNFS